MRQTTDLTLTNNSDKITPIYPIKTNELNIDHFKVNDKILQAQYNHYCTVDQETVQLLAKYDIKPELYHVDEMMGLLEVLNGLSSSNLKKLVSNMSVMGLKYYTTIPSSVR